MNIFSDPWPPQEARKSVQDATLQDSVSGTAALGKVQLKSRKTLRGHLAKIYAMQWGTDSKYIHTHTPICTLKYKHIPRYLPAIWCVTASDQTFYKHQN